MGGGAYRSACKNGFVRWAADLAASFAREGGGLKVKSAGAADFSLRGEAEGLGVLFLFFLSFPRHVDAICRAYLQS